MKNKLRFPKSHRGQSLVELAISLIILVFLLSGAVEFGIAFFQFVQLRDAAQEGALFGSMNPPDADGDQTEENAIIARAQASSSSPINLATDPNVAFNVVVTDSKYCEGGSLQVTITYPHRIFMPVIPVLIGSNTIPLTARVTDTILTPICPPGP